MFGSSKNFDGDGGFEFFFFLNQAEGQKWRNFNLSKDGGNRVFSSGD